MRRALFSSLVWLCAVSLAAAQLARVEPARGWKTAEGQAFQASVVSFDGTTVVLRMANGAPAQAPAARLSTEDQAWLAEWQKKQPIKVVMPDVVGVETANVKAEVVSEDAASEKFIYRTQNFEFESQGKFNQTLLREVARNFEATYELLKALPWAIGPAPEKGTHFKARLLKNREAYFAAGGPQNSGGVYQGGAGLFMVPFESIGVKIVGKGYAKDDDFDYSTMVHELTHQMMHSWLRLLPQWIVEGTAEYTGTLPLKNGRFRVSAAKNGLKDHFESLKRRGVGMPEPYPLEQLFPITNEQWQSILESDPRASHRLYFTSYLLVYYFMHLDGKGDGQLFVRYFREVGTVRSEVQKYRLAVEEFKKLPGVEVRPDGSYRWPGNLQHPDKPAIIATPDALAEFQKKTLALLLDGRSDAELMKLIRSAYAKLGIRL